MLDKTRGEVGFGKKTWGEGRDLVCGVMLGKTRGEVGWGKNIG